MKRIFSILCSLAVIFILTACGAYFEGSRMGNNSQFILTYNILNTTDSQLLTLKAGDIVEVEIVNNAGRLSVTVQKEDDEPIYQNENVPTSTFEIEIKEDGIYKFTVTGKKSKGSASFMKSTKE